MARDKHRSISIESSASSLFRGTEKGEGKNAKLAVETVESVRRSETVGRASGGGRSIPTTTTTTTTRTMTTRGDESIDVVSRIELSFPPATRRESPLGIQRNTSGRSKV